MIGYIKKDEINIVFVPVKNDMNSQDVENELMRIANTFKESFGDEYYFAYFPSENVIMTICQLRKDSVNVIPIRRGKFTLERLEQYIKQSDELCKNHEILKHYEIKFIY